MATWEKTKKMSPEVVEDEMKEREISSEEDTQELRCEREGSATREGNDGASRRDSTALEIATSCRLPAAEARANSGTSNAHVHNDHEDNSGFQIFAPPTPRFESSSPRMNAENESSRAEKPPYQALCVLSLPSTDDGSDNKKEKGQCDISDVPTPDELPVTAALDTPDGHNHSRNQWSQLIHGIRMKFCGAIKAWSQLAALHPWTTVILVVILSMTSIGIGMATNFRVEVDGDKLWPPNNSLSRQHHAWILDESGFPKESNQFFIVIHRNGGNVLSYEGVIRSFEVIDAMRSHPDYGPVCQEYVYGFNYGLEKSERTCPIHGIIDYWDEDVTVFKDEVQTDEEAIQAMSSMEYSDGLPVDENAVFGNMERYENGTLKSAEGFLFRLDFPPTEEADELELELLDQLLELQEAWTIDPLNMKQYQLEFIGSQSVDEEVVRAIVKDIPLMPLAFLVMSIFNIIIYSKCDRVKSQGLLGIGAVVAVLLAILTGYGIMFTIGM
jgi:hypothetical protein